LLASTLGFRLIAARTFDHAFIPATGVILVVLFCFFTAHLTFVPTTRHTALFTFCFFHIDKKLKLIINGS
jgi:hypothetical protein